jgi:hypothetical protein
VDVTFTLDDRRLRALQSKAPDLIDDVLAKVAIQTANRAQSNIRAVGAIDTGFMINSTRARKSKPLSWTVGTAADYGVYIEFGTRYVSPRPWLGPAMNEARRTFGQIAQGVLRGFRG